MVKKYQSIYDKSITQKTNTKHKKFEFVSVMHYTLFYVNKKDVVYFPSNLTVVLCSHFRFTILTAKLKRQNY